jgi:hypothetical protein
MRIVVQLMMRMLSGQAIQSFREIERIEFGRDLTSLEKSKPFNLSVSKWQNLPKYRWPRFSSKFYFDSHWYGSLGRPFKWLLIDWIMRQASISGTFVDVMRNVLYYFTAVELCAIFFWSSFLLPSFARARELHQWPSDLLLNFSPGFRRWLIAPAGLALVLYIAFQVTTRL